MRLVFEMTIAKDSIIVEDVAALLERLAEAMRAELIASPDGKISLNAGRGVKIGNDKFAFAGCVQ